MKFVWRQFDFNNLRSVILDFKITHSLLTSGNSMTTLNFIYLYKVPYASDVCKFTTRQSHEGEVARMWLDRGWYGAIKFNVSRAVPDKKEQLIPIADTTSQYNVLTLEYEILVNIPETSKQITMSIQNKETNIKQRSNPNIKVANMWFCWDDFPVFLKIASIFQKVLEQMQV